VLCDFGVSRIVEEIVQATGVTTSGVAEGTLRWSAPEVISSDKPERFTAASDIWSFGCTGYEVSLNISNPFQE
jgi:serine/threonine protein kinase